MLTYAGKGYSAAFTENYDAIIARLGNGEGLILVSGPDDICQPLLGDNQAHCFRDSVTRRDKQAAAAVSALLGNPIQPDSVFKLDKAVVERMREAFAAGHTRTACEGCEWFDLCTTIAEAGFADTRLQIKPACA